MTAQLDLSTQPAPPAYRPRPRHLVLLVRAWRWLTSMRTALVLLFLLALGAVPGSLLPQRSLNQAKVDAYLAQHPTLGPILDRLSMFNVFGAPWFAAIYILLFISLVGCLTPRIRLHARALRTPPPKAPRFFNRLPESTSYETDAAPGEAAAAAADRLRRGRWRVVTRDEAGVVSVCAERGYLRETGNLLFHVSLTVLLVAMAVGKLWGYTGTVLVQEGDGFCNTVQQYDSFNPGQLVNGASLAPFCANLHRFTATYDPDGTANEFRANISYTEGASEKQRHDVLRVNHPLRIEGLRLYLLGHGFSPVFTVRDSSGQVFKNISAPFLPQNSEFVSQGALKLPDAKPKQFALDGLFLPTPLDTGGGVLTSIWPAATRPAVSIFAYEGDLGLDSGQPQSVYSIDRQQLETGALKRVGRANLGLGQSLRLRDGTKITFAGYKQWASLQVSRDPAQTYVLLAAGGILLGLLLSLRVRRRRLWLRATPIEAGDGERRTVIELGGLARTDSGAFSDEFGRIAHRLRGEA